MDLTLPLKLKVEVLKARNLISADSNGKSDPYCRVSVGQKVFCTTVQPNTLNPEWQQSIAFINDDLAPFATCQETPSSIKILLLGYLSIEIWDRDFGNPDDFIGRLVVPLSSLPLTQIDTSTEQWYPLHRNSVQLISGDIQLKMALESVEDGLVLSNTKLNEDFLTVSIPLGYQIPILIDNDVLNFPGSSEIIEIGFSKVYVELGSVSIEAILLMTNYRLIIMSTSDNNRSGASVPSSLLLNNISSQMMLNTDFNMWIALNNIASVEHGSGSTVVRRHVSGAAENVDSATVTIRCYDCRYVQIVFVMSSENGVNLVKPNDQPMPLKILKKVQTSRRKAIRKLRKLKRIKKNHKQNIVKEHDYDDSQVTDGALFVEGNNNNNDGGKSLLEECNEIGDMDPGIRSDSFDEYDYDLLDDFPEEEGIEDGYDEVDGMTTPTEQDIQTDHYSSLELAYRGLTLPSPTKTLVSSFMLRLDDITANIADSPPANIYTKSESISDHLVRWDINSILLKDIQRFMSDRWRVCAINSQEYSICSSYPSFVFVPAQIKADPDIEEIAKFRSKGRIPSLVWMDKNTHSFLLRSAQPLTGTSGRHCKEDEKLIEYAMANGPVGGGMTIFDARSFTAVQGNKLMGKGTEDVSRYSGCKLVYLDIPNIHAVRESYDSVKSLAFSSTSSKWLSNLENTQWLSYISLILKGASLIARYIGYQEGSALVHCSDGWDRTAQLTSLTQLMIDSYYRTIDGFMVLISKEWLAYGHKFNDRLGHPLHPNERSPIFLQFLDCVYQMLQQYTTYFEFTESLLLCIAEHINSRWFGTFLCNCDQDRVKANVFNGTLPLDVHISAVKDTFINPQYYPTNEKLIPAWTIRRLKLWDNYFLAWDGTSSILPVLATECDNNNNIITDQETADYSNTTTQVGGVATGGVESDTVVWMSNEKAKSCLLCQQKFSFTRRKHHCRNCGRIYCNECSKQRASLSHLGYSEAVRVCDNCFRIQNNITTHKATNNLETHQEDGFQVFEVKTRTNTE